MLESMSFWLGERSMGVKERSVLILMYEALACVQKGWRAYRHECSGSMTALLRHWRSDVNRLGLAAYKPQLKRCLSSC